MVTTVNKIGMGSDDDPVRPDTTSTSWEKVSETDTTMTINILD
ncbi:hypothetical protein [Desulfosporosinus sp. SB140]